MDDTRPDDYYKTHMEYAQSYTLYAPHEGFCPNYSEIRTAFDKRVQVYTKRISAAFQSGKFDINQTDVIIEELKSAGTDRIVNEIQKQLDQWRSTNKKH